jgi:DNA invertase Pin-like site-specific DNA recombinase
MDIIGYIRVSSTKQTSEHQHHELKKFAKENKFRITKWFDETISSRKPLSKRQLGKILSELNEGDILVACEISRLGRSLLEVMRILEYCLNKGCQVWTIKENYRLGNDIQSKVMAFAFGLSAEIERNLISQRTKSAMNTMHAHGYKLGRPNGFSPKTWKLVARKKVILRMLAQGRTKRDMAKVLGVTTTTLNRFIKRMDTIK